MYTPGPQTQQPPQMGVEPLNSGVAPEPQAKPKAPGKSKGNTDVGAFIQQLISPDGLRAPTSGAIASDPF
jgi:hypothetical protein